MSRYEHREPDLSALMDGELEGEQALEAIDALVEDEELRRFWKASRTLDRALAASGEREERISPPEGLWDRIEDEAAPRRSARVIRLRTTTLRNWAAAAAIVFAVGLSATGIIRMPTLTGEANAKTVELGAGQGGMNEDRFIELTTELLRADPRYHRKMLDILEMVNQQAYMGGRQRETRLEGEGDVRGGKDNSATETPSDLPRNQEPDTMSGEIEGAGAQTARQSETGSRQQSGALEWNLW